jgi:hypothetical protein
MASTTCQSFRLEREMFDPVLAAIPDIFPANSGAMRVLREPSVGNVVPDLLIGQWNPGPGFDIPPLTNVARHVVALLQRRGGGTPTELIEEELFLTNSGLTRAIAQLKRAGVVVVEGGGRSIRVSPQLAAAVDVKLIAVEMKMKRWREALSQATRYLDFADEAYVVLDGGQVEFNDEIRRAFELSAVGLFLQTGSAFEKVLGACPIPRILSADRWLAAFKVVNSFPYCAA